MKLLLIEDELELAASIIEYLKQENYLCEVAVNSKQALHKIETFEYDCIILDVMLPDGNGIDLLRVLKEQNKQEGVIIISAKNAIEDKILGLQIGADDYLTKPFHLPELAARINAIIRRKHFANNNIIHHNELKVDLLAKQVFINNQALTLTKKEFDLLLYFLSNKNRVLSKTAIAEHISGDIADMLNNHDYVYAHIKNLKKKLTEAGGKNYLTTIYGTGYKWVM
jgi:DNA-binding response OmpR family regulator